jgi:hypothetical protein
VKTVKEVSRKIGHFSWRPLWPDTVITVIARRCRWCRVKIDRVAGVSSLITLLALQGQVRATYRGGRLIRKLKSGQYRLYSRKKDPKTGHQRNLGTFGTRKAAEAHERAVQYFKRQ